MLSVVKHPWAAIFVSNTLNSIDVLCFVSDVAVFIIFPQSRVYMKQIQRKKIFHVFHILFSSVLQVQKHIVLVCVLLDWFAFIETLHIKWLLLPHKSSLTSNNNILHLWKVSEACVYEWSCGIIYLLAGSQVIPRHVPPDNGRELLSFQTLNTCHCKAVYV